MNCWEDPLDKEMATHSSILAWRIPWIEEPGGLQLQKSQMQFSDWTTTSYLISQIIRCRWALTCPLSFMSYWKTVVSPSVLLTPSIFCSANDWLNPWCPFFLCMPLIADHSNSMVSTVILFIHFICYLVLAIWLAIYFDLLDLQSINLLICFPNILYFYYTTDTLN